MANGITSRDVPQPDCAVRTPGSEDLAVGAERHRVDRSPVAIKWCSYGFSGRHVPHPCRAIVISSGKGLAVRAERDRPDRSRLAGEGGDASATSCSPDGVEGLARWVKAPSGRIPLASTT